MIDTIIHDIDKISKNITVLDILMNHVHSNILKEKWAFTINTYNNLTSNLNKYQDNEEVNINYIINDYETTCQMINEFKEDLYPHFDSNVFILIDSLNKSTIKEFQQFEKEILEEHHNFQNYLDYFFKSSLSSLKAFIKSLIEYLENSLLPNEQRFVPFDNLYECLKLECINKSSYFRVYQTVSRALKYTLNKEEFNDYYLTIKFNNIIMLAGEKDV